MSAPVTKMDAGDTPSGCPPPPGGLYHAQDAAGLFLKLSFVADRPPPPHCAYQERLMAAGTSAEYLS